MTTLRGQLVADQYRSYTKPVAIGLRYCQIEKDPFTEPTEAQVWFRVDDKCQSAFVPLFIVDESSESVQAILIGEKDDHILVSFPPTNYGQTRFYSSEAGLKAISHPQAK